MTQELKFTCKSFDNLSNIDVYNIFKLRQDVFMLEQNGLYQDFDGKDQQCLHLMGYVDDIFACYSRLVPLGLIYEEYCSFGRVATPKEQRGKQYGKQLIATALSHIKQAWPNTPCKISAQAYLQKFYEDFNFERIGDEYLEDNIPHIAMVLKA